MASACSTSVRASANRPVWRSIPAVWMRPPEPTSIGDRAGHASASCSRSASSQIAEPVERAPQLEAYIDLLLPPFLRLGQVAERLARLFETGHSLLVCRPPLGLDRGLPEIGRGLVPHLSAPEVVGDQLDDIVGPSRVELSRPSPAAAWYVRRGAPARRLHHVLGQRVLEAVHQLGILSAREDEVEGHAGPAGGPATRSGARWSTRETREIPKRRPPPPPLKRLLERLRDAIEASRDDVVDGRRDRHVGRLSPRSPFSTTTPPVSRSWRSISSTYRGFPRSSPQAS